MMIGTTLGGAILQIGAISTSQLILAIAAIIVIAGIFTVLKILIGFALRLLPIALFVAAILGALWFIAPELYNEIIDMVAGLV